MSRLASPLITSNRQELVPGLLTLNFTDLTITNTSDGIYEHSHMVNVPYYGITGVLIVRQRHMAFHTTFQQYHNIRQDQADVVFAASFGGHSRPSG